MKISKGELIMLLALCLAGTAHPFSITQHQQPLRRTHPSRTLHVRKQPGASPRSSLSLQAAFVHPSDLMYAKEALHSTATTLVQVYENLVRQYPGLDHPEAIIETAKTAYGDLILQHPSLVVAQDAVQTSTKNWLESYGDLLSQYPITTKSTTASILACAGDAIAQWRSGEKYDIKRGLAFMGFGAMYTGAFQHTWFTYLQQHIADWGANVGVWGPEHVTFPIDKVVNSNEWWRYFDIVSSLEHPPSPTALAAGKLLINQFLMIPLVYMPLFLTMTGALAGLDWKASFARGQYLYFYLLKRNWFFWLPVQFMQFLVIPTDFQIPFLSVASLVWTVILSSIGGSATTAPQSSIVVYDEEPIEGSEDDFLVRVRQVMPGAANQVTDDVRWEDLVDAVPMMVNVTSDPRAGFTTGGFAAGLLAAAADEAILGQTVAQVLGSTAPGVGVAIVTAVGAGMGLMAGYMANNTSTDTAGDDMAAQQQQQQEIEKENYSQADPSNESSWRTSSWRETNAQHS